jgi:hypothetical protein
VEDDSHKNADAVVVKEFAPSFDVMDAAVLGSLREGKDEMDYVQLDPSTAREHSEWKGFDEDEEMEESDD